LGDPELENSCHPELFELGTLLLPDRLFWVLDTESRDLDLGFPEDSDLDFEGDN
tara:strand:+ start:337 stop:498 length:162 start_codon:yes stop_codon:yes gene_type:complete